MWSQPPHLSSLLAIAIVAALYVALCRQAVSGDVIVWLLVAVVLIAFLALG